MSEFGLFPPNSINNRKLLLFLAVTMTQRTIEILND